LREREDVTRAVRHVGINLQIRPVSRIGGLPLLFVAFKLATVADKRCLRRQRQHFCFLAGPVIVHPLRVFGVADQSADIQLAFDFPLVADDADDRYPLARPFAFIQNVEAVGLHPHDLFAVNLTRPQRLAKQRGELLIERRSTESCLVVRVEVQRRFFVDVVKILGDADGVVE